MEEGQHHVFTRSSSINKVNLKAQRSSWKTKIITYQINRNQFYLLRAKPQKEQMGKRKEMLRQAWAPSGRQIFLCLWQQLLRGAETHWLMNKTTWGVYSQARSRWQVSSGKFQLGVAKPATFPPTLLRTWSTQPTRSAVRQHSSLLFFFFFYFSLLLFIGLVLLLWKQNLMIHYWMSHFVMFLCSTF